MNFIIIIVVITNFELSDDRYNYEIKVSIILLNSIYQDFN